MRFERVERFREETDICRDASVENTRDRELNRKKCSETLKAVEMLYLEEISKYQAEYLKN